MAKKYTKCPQNIPNGRKMLEMTKKYTHIEDSMALKNVPKFFLNMKIHHLATILSTATSLKNVSEMF
jgi:hypothetical protein